MILIALGSNLPSRFGTSEQTLAEACVELSLRGVRILEFSNVYMTAPVPVSKQPFYRNAVARVETHLSPVALLKLLKQIEQAFGRDCGAERNAARVLDLDLLAYGDAVVQMDGLCVPHPRMHERGFVLYPMRDVVPQGWKHPVLGVTIEQMLDHLPEDQRLDIQQWEIA